MVVESEEEADLVIAEIHRLLGTLWTDQHGVQAPLGVPNVLVTSYDDQANLLRARPRRGPLTAGIALGTVDKC